MKAGAVEFLTKPCRDQELLDAVRSAIEGHRARRKVGKHVALLREQFASLTGREKEVVGFVTAGLLNKKIAAELDISEVTVKMHRGNIMGIELRGGSGLCAARPVSISARHYMEQDGRLFSIC